MNTKKTILQSCLHRPVRLALALIVVFAILFGPGSVPTALANTQIDISGPAGSGAFGQVTLLPDGNIIVVDTSYDAPGPISDVGAVYLYNGSTGALVSALKGSREGDQVGSGKIKVLNNGNFVVTSPNWDNASVTDAGAVTWGSSTAGVNGAVSSSNSLVGSHAGSKVGSGGVFALGNGNYVASSPDWDNGTLAGVGAVTWGNGASGVKGTVSSSNSLVGSQIGDNIGSGGITVLSNDNYVVVSPNWHNGAEAAGAVTWGNGTTGIKGTVSVSNSLVGTNVGDIGFVFPLGNSNYLVASPNWDSGITDDAGAVTWGNGTTGVKGVVSASNSLVGSTFGDHVGFPIPLINGNYVVMSPNWNNGTGAATWGNGATGLKGVVSSTNSLVGSKAGDQVGSIGPLSNGNYLVFSPNWDNDTVVDAGAVTWGNGTTGVKGVVSASNSLVGTKAGDQVGSAEGALLNNGNYVVASPLWDNTTAADAGAVTWGNGTTGVKGAVSTSNSLYGTKAGDRVGSDGVRGLMNGNYVVVSPNWGNGTMANAGAVTWGNGTTGVKGLVSAGNSLVGSTADDQIGLPGEGGVMSLNNGNYVVASPDWDNGPIVDAGAVTWGNGTTGVKGPVTTSNSLYGSSTGDKTGYYGVTALSNGNYVARSPFWDNSAVIDVGAVTWGNGATGVKGPVSTTNSLVGSQPGDSVGLFGVTELSNGNYVVASYSWSNATNNNVGAVTWLNGVTPTHAVVSEANSLVGSTYGDSVGNVVPEDDGNYVVESFHWDNGLVVDSGAVTVSQGIGCTAGSAVGIISTDNSILGTAAGGGDAMNYAYDPLHHQLVVGRPADNIVSLSGYVDCTKHIYLPLIRR